MTRRRWRPFRFLARWRCWLTTAVLAWLVFAGWMLYVAVTRDGVRLPALFAIYLLLTVALSVAAFVLIGVDKRRAITQRPRISERTLHAISAAGGWPGAYLARRLFRHKTLKLTFRAVSWAIIAAHFAMIAYGLWSGWFWTGVKVLMGWG